MTTTPTPSTNYRNYSIIDRYFSTKSDNNSTIVHYQCGCGRYRPLVWLYYCGGCNCVLCGLCVNEEVESYYCPNCLDNMASAEAFLNQNRCKKCYDCPVCFNSLSYNVNGDMYFLNCGSCHWNSISIGMTSSTPLITKEVNPSQQQEFTRVLELVQKEAKEALSHKEKNRPTGRRKLFTTRQPMLYAPSNIASTTSTTSSSSSSSSGTRMPLAIGDVDKMVEDKSKPVTFAKATPQIDPIPDFYYTSTPLSAVTTLQQRLMQPQQQALLVKDVIPVKKLLHTRRSKRCKKCDKLLVKPDLNPTKIEFKRAHFAYSTIPNVMLACPPVPDKDGVRVELIFINPLHSIVKMSFPYASTIPLPHHNAKVELSPDNTFIAGVPEEDEGESETIKSLKAADNPRFIGQRRDNKVHILLRLEPVAGTIQGQIKFGFGVQVQFSDPSVGDQFTSYRLDLEVAEATENTITQETPTKS